MSSWKEFLLILSASRDWTSGSSPANFPSTAQEVNDTLAIIDTQFIIRGVSSPCLCVSLVPEYHSSRAHMFCKPQECGSGLLPALRRITHDAAHLRPESPLLPPRATCSWQLNPPVLFQNLIYMDKLMSRVSHWFFNHVGAVLLA